MAIARQPQIPGLVLSVKGRGGGRAFSKLILAFEGGLTRARPA